MRSWWKTLGLMAGMACGLTIAQTAVHAQFPPPGPGGFGMPPGGGMPGMPVNMGAPPGGGMGMSAFSGMPPGPGADFPNIRPPSEEPVSPFSIKDEGMPNAFTELVDNRAPRSPSLVFRGEYLGWWIRPGPVRVPLVSTTNNLAGGELGAQGEPNSVFLVPGDVKTVDYRLLTGVRLAAGIAPDFCPPFEVSGFSFTRNYVVFGGGSSDATGLYLARPVQLVDVVGVPGVGLNTVEFVNVPGFAAGQVDVLSRLSFWNVETNFFFNFADNGTIRLDLILGYRHTDLYESLQVNSQIRGVNANVNFGGAGFPPGATTFARDAFNGRNAFDGGQIGIRGIFNCQSLKIFTDAKLAMGSTSQFLTIDGTSTIDTGVAGQGNVTLPGGILALPSNIGVHSQSRFSIIPEVSMSLSYQATQHIRLYGGYNMMYWNNIIRPGDHVTNAVDSRQIPTDQNFINGFRAANPSFPEFTIRDFFAHGFFAGIEIGF